MKEGNKMIKVGVIAEYNPFHNGHLYHLNKVKEMFKDAVVILVLAGNFTQRGDVSVIDKWNKAKLALDFGFDLVVELPFNVATSSASIYAEGAIKILNNLDCDYLVFGSEMNDVNTLKKAALKTLNNKDYEEKVKNYLETGVNFPKASSLALEDIANVLINKPNDVLAFEYVRSIIKTESKIKPVSIKRTNDYHEEKINKKITSATSIRKNLNNKKLIKNTMPKESLKLINNISIDDYFSYIKYEIMTNDNLNEVQDIDEGIENKLKKEIIYAKTLQDLITRIKSKRYSYNKIKRMLLHILVKTKKDYEKDVKFIRVLGLNSNGKKILKDAKEKTCIPIITKFKKEYEKLFKDDIKASFTYSLITNYNVLEEYKSSIVKD